MFKELIVNTNQYETRVALLEDGSISEIFLEQNNENNLAGNIYKARVQRVLPGMQAAFVDIGLSQGAFIYVKDVIPHSIDDFEKIFDDETDLDDVTAMDANNIDTDSTTYFKGHQIEDILQENQELLVQVSKAPIGTKGARVTTRITLPGRFLVYMPTENHIGVSRRIEDETLRQTLKDKVSELRDTSCGYIIRTASENVSEEKLLKEMKFLNNLWENVQIKFKSAKTPSLIHKELSLILRPVRDLLTNEADKLVIDSYSGYQEILSFLDALMPTLKDSVELYDGTEPIFDYYNLEVDISRALKKKVWLKSGGYIVIEHTEALVTIDVNTGRYVGKHNLEETILKINLEAVKEIAYQIRLRDLGGIIVIDFIDMEKKSNQEKVFNALKDAFKRDRSKTKVLPISEFGLIQMTRKRIRKSLNRILCEPCFYCEGEGYLQSPSAICNNIFREIQREYKDVSNGKLILKVNPEIAELLHEHENHMIENLENIVDKPIIIYPTASYHLEQFEIYEVIH